MGNGYGAIWDPALAEGLGTRPNVYINFESAPVPRPVYSADGVVFHIGVADWGPVGETVDIISPVQVDRYLGTDVNNVTRRGVLDALAVSARSVLFHRIASGAAAEATRDLNDTDATPTAALRVTAKYPGAFGNTLKAEVVTNIVNTSLKDLNIYEGTLRRETFTGATNTDILADFAAKGSALVDLTIQGAGARALAAVTATALTGGDSGTVVVASDYTDALEAASDARFRTLTVDTFDTAIQASIRTWIVDQRAGGNRFTAVLGANPAATFAELVTQAEALDSEGVVFVVNGFTRGTIERPPVAAALTVAAAQAVEDTQSLTRYVIPEATVISRRFSPTEFRVGLEKGFLFLSTDGEKVFIEQGLNTLQVESQVSPKSVDWRKIRYVAIQDELVDRVGVYLGDNYIGKVSNDERGRQEAVNQVQVILDAMAQERLLQTGVITNPDGTTSDVTPKAYLDARFISTSDRVYVAVSGKAADAIEKFFLTVVI